MMRHPSAESEPQAGAPEHAGQSRWPSYVSAAAGGWLFLSVFAWAHSTEARINGAVVGGLITAVALLSVRFWAIRVVNTVLALWLAASTLAMSDISGAAVWNDLAVAALVLLSSFVPGPEEPRVIVPRGRR